MKVKMNTENSENLDVGLSLLLSPYKDCIIQVVNNPEIAEDYNFETTEDRRYHLLLILGPEGSAGDSRNLYLERSVHLDI